MPKVFATVPGAEVWIPPYGTARNDSPAVVPGAVGAELAKVDGLRVEPDEPVPAPKKKLAAEPAKSEKE